MATVPGPLIWEIVKKNNAFLVKQFGNGNAKVQFSKEPNNLYNVNSFTYSGLANKKTVSIQAVGDEEQSIVLSTVKTKKQNKPGSLNHRSVIKKEFCKMAKAVKNQICVSYVDPASFLPAIQAGAQMVEIGNYDLFYDMGIHFSPEQILKLTYETRRILPFITLSVTVPHTISLPEQVKLAELLEHDGADIIQTEGGKCSNPSKSGVLGLIEKVIGNSVAFSLGLATTLAILSITASFAGKSFGQIGQGLPLAAFGLPVLMGLNLMEVALKMQDLLQKNDYTMKTNTRN